MNVYFNVNFNTFTSLINSEFFWYVKYIDFRMHGATIKIIHNNLSALVGGTECLSRNFEMELPFYAA